MKVACPSCKTRFQLDPAKLQPVGRHVRCAKCGHRWLQLPEGMELPAGLMPLESSESEDKAVPAAESPPAEPSTPEPSAEPAAAETTTDAGEPEASSAGPPETPAEMAESLAAIAEQVAAAGQAPGAEKSTPLEKSTGGEFAGPVQRIGARMTGPIIVPPKMKPARPARRSANMGLLVTIGVVIGLLLAAYLLRDALSRVIPGADALYSILGISTDSPADDLEISIDKVDAQDDGGKRFFSVTATIFNLSEYPVDVPPLMIVPVDEAGNAMAPIRFRLSERVAEPGQNIKFQKSFDDWPIDAKSFVLSVEDAP